MAVTASQGIIDLIYSYIREQEAPFVDACLKDFADAMNGAADDAERAQICAEWLSMYSETHADIIRRVRGW